MAMHKPKKQRRFQDGGDVEENQMKQRGLDISNRAREEGTEKTSFFQRLREGNIDDPNSAAYKKYGAGRARLDDQIEAGKSKLADEVREMVKAKTPVAAVQSSKASDGDVSAYDLRTETAANAPKINQSAAKPKSGIVTKKQLEESGLSLRDYMNKQQGKTRRGGKAPDAAKPAAKPSELTDKPSAPAAKSSEPPVSNSYRLEGAGRPKPAAKSSEPATSAGKSMFQRIAEKETIADKIRRRGEESLKGSGMKAGGSVKMAKGGSINGIAKRGLTNCKQR